MTTLTIGIVLIPLMGIDNVMCVSLTLTMTAINQEMVTHPRQYLLID